MNYTSTRDSALCTGASTAILTGIAPGGGLFAAPHSQQHLFFRRRKRPQGIW